MPVTPDERLASIEVQLASLCKCVHQQGERMERVASRLEVIARLEERWQHLDKQLGVLTRSFESELARRSKIDDNLFDRVRKLESGGAMNSHGREMAERVALFMIGGLALYTVQAIWGG